MDINDGYMQLELVKESRKVITFYKASRVQAF